MTIIDAIHDENLFRPFFKDMDTWKSWFVVLKSIFGLDMDKDELAVFMKLTGRTTPPTEQTREAWFIIGRRGGKSFIVALIAAYLATFRDYTPFLGPGKRAVIMVIATDRKQARVIMRYLQALLEQTPMLAAMIEKIGSESVELTNNVSIEITTCSHRTVRGYTIVAALCDEIGFWRSEESANPAEEILNALRPAMATIPTSLLIGLGTPYRRSGVLYEAHRKHYGQDDSRIQVSGAVIKRETTL